MAGNAKRPISVTTAPMMPVAVAKRAQVASAATAMDPGRARAAIRIEWNRRSTMFARSTMYPMNKNRGIAVSTSLDMTEKARSVIRNERRPHTAGAKIESM